MISETKKCKTCLEYKSIELFYKRAETKDGLCYSCKECQKQSKREINKNRTPEEKKILNARQYQWKKAHPEMFLKMLLKLKYNLAIEIYNELKILQDNKCAICKSNLTEDKKFGVDHCHESKIVRGLLCLTCNSGLGFFKDNLENLENAISYLKNPPINQIKKTNAKTNNETK